MRPLGMVLLLSLALCCFLDAARAEDKVRDATCYQDLPGCHKNYDPVCGTNGKTYGNECMLCLENKEKGTHIRIKKEGDC
ncbi:serine protease inhibitor Kazal-type 1-like [Dromiciops gliroides]|uniref:serine protease inhibitor Kazal-type 1-like n=1 Tax=Dromiciops gliroides TaxID=33562 RepID=UPI001CC66E51|nr:serine protease inhibitor Kazal-type 1-like [Dromiciops gliroides]